MDNFLISSDINNSPFVYFHGSSSAYSEQIEKEGITNNDSQRMWLAENALKTYNFLCKFTLDGLNESFIYNRFPKESIDRINYAYTDFTNGNKNRTYLTFFDAQAIPYTRRIGGEFYSDLYDFVLHLEWILDNYEEFDEERRHTYNKQLSLWDKKFNGEFDDWNPYAAIAKKDIQFRLNKFIKFKNSHTQLLEKHNHGVIYVCELSMEKIVNSIDVSSLSISIDEVLPSEIIDSIIVTPEMEASFNPASRLHEGLNKQKSLNAIRETGRICINTTLEQVKTIFKEKLKT